LEVPANMAVNVKLNSSLTWSLTPNTSKYNLQVAEDANFSKLVVNKNNLPLNNYLTTELDYETTYWWRVASVNDAGTSSWSDVFSFTTSNPTPDKPYLAGPANNATINTTTPNLFWTAVPGAETYSLQISKDDTFEGFSVRYTKSNIEDTFHIVPVGRLTNETDYWWRVKTVNSGGESSYSTAWKFNTGVPLPTPSGLLPENGTETTLTPTLSWNVVPGATSYNVQLGDREGFELGFIVNEFSWEDVNYVVPKDLLTDGKTYYWRVKANSGSGSGPFSPTMNFVAKSGTSVLDEISKSNITVYPNPTSESIYVKLNDVNMIIDKIIISDGIGNVIESKNINSNYLNLNLNNIPTGVYFLQIYSNNNIYNESITIIR
jgi:hypothetical protein